MSYTPDAVRAIIAAGEGRTVKFWLRLADVSALADLIVSMARAEGGLLLVGVGHHGDIVGADSEEVRRTSHLALAAVNNGPRLDHYGVSFGDRHVAIISIGKSDRVTVVGSPASDRTDAAVDVSLAVMNQAELLLRKRSLVFLYAVRSSFDGYLLPSMRE